jgi:hypothetical protein
MHYRRGTIDAESASGLCTEGLGEATLRYLIFNRARRDETSRPNW